MADLALQSWAHEAIAQAIDRAAQTLAAYCAKPRSEKRLHRARKALARLRAALVDLGAPAGAAPEFLTRIEQLHSRAGKLRDADVLIARIKAYREHASQSERGELRALRIQLRDRRKRARRKLRRLLLKLPELHR